MNSKLTYVHLLLGILAIGVNVFVPGTFEHFGLIQSGTGNSYIVYFINGAINGAILVFLFDDAIQGEINLIRFMTRWK